jgi:outer membrane protein assembly factor BamB
VAGLIAAPVAAEDWPQFQGPRRDGTSAETGLARTWPAGGPPVVWTIALGPGFGGAAVKGEEVYLLDREGEQKDVLRCLDFKTGAERWRYAYEAPGRLDYQGSRSVPTVTDSRVYTIGGFGHVYCFDRATHQPVWSLRLEDRYPSADMPKWGWAQSPLLHEGRVYVAPLGSDVGLAALDAETGKEIWRSGTLGTTHSTTAIVELFGTPQVLLVSVQGRRDGLLSSFDPRTGAVLWTSGAYDNIIPIPAPLRIDDSRLFVTGGYEAGSVMLEVKRGGSGVETAEIFRIKRGSQIHPPLLHGGHIYMLANENWNEKRRRAEGGLMCLDLQGQEQWRTGESPYIGRGGMLLADGMLIIQDGYNGALRLVEPNPQKFTLLAQANVFGVTDDSDGRMWAPMALSQGKLLLRSQSELKCVDVRKPPGG